jgi:lipoprotein-releasing system ATP-binding protein
VTRSVIETFNVTKQYIQGSALLEILKGITARFEQGERYAITGVSGAGKSTFLHILAGLDAPTAGSVLFNGEDINAVTSAKRSQFLNESLGLIFQSPYLIDELSVVENVALKGLIANQTYDEAIQRAHELLKIIGLSQKAESLPATLSGGQQQRIAILRALFNKPPFLLADEPTGNLDERTGKDIVDFLIDCQKQWHMGIIVSSHDPYVAQKMEHKLQLHDGLLRVI